MLGSAATRWIRCTAFGGMASWTVVSWTVALAIWACAANPAEARHPFYRGPVYRAPIHRAPVWVAGPRVVAAPRNYGISYWGSAYHRAPTYYRDFRPPVAAVHYSSGYYSSGYYGGYYGVRHRHVYRYPATYYGIYSTFPSYYVSPFLSPIGIDPWWGLAPIGWLGNQEAGRNADLLANAAGLGAANPNDVNLDEVNQAAAVRRAQPAPQVRPAADDPFAQGRLVQIGGAVDEQKPVRALLARVPGLVAQATQGGGVDAGTIRQVVNDVTARRSAAGRSESRPVDSAEISSLDDRRRAGKYVEQGDELFARGRYLEAMSVYRRAAESARDVAQPWFRLGFAYLAAGRYERSSESFREGLQRDPGYFESGFRLAQLYGGEEAAKESHVEALAQAALDDDANPDLAYLVGVFLHFDGQAERAVPFFDRAEKLAADPQASTSAARATP